MRPWLPPLGLALLVGVSLLALGCKPRDRGPWHGDRTLLVLPIAWEGTQADVPPERLNELIFTGERSLASWFAENSAGAFRVTGQVLPWKPAGGAFADKRDRCGPAGIAERALAAHAGGFDLSRYDRDGDGKVDDLLVIHTGRGGLDRFSHRCIFGASEGANRLAALQLHGAGSKGEALPIGLYVHEGLHAHYGLQDDYGDERRGDYGIGVWGVMGYGQWGASASMALDDLWAHPSNLAAFNKERLGWIDLKRVRRSKTVELAAVEGSGRGLEVRLDDGTRYVLEVRGGVGSSADLPGSGLLIWVKPKGKRFRLVQADGRDDLARGEVFKGRPLPPNGLNWGDASDPFPGSLGITEWTHESTGFGVRDVRKTDNGVRLRLVIP